MTDAIVKPPLGEQTVAQTPNIALAGLQTRVAGWSMCAPGGSIKNPLGYAGWLGGNPYWGTYDVYRWVLQHHTVRHARSVVRSPVIRSGWNYEYDKDVPQPAREFIEKTFNRLHRNIVRQALRALDYGCVKFEVVWGVDADGMYTIDKLKELRIDWTATYADKAGKFLGFGAWLLDGEKKPPPVLDAASLTLSAAQHKAWLYVWDAEAGDLSGRSQIENFRATAWVPWLLAAQQCALIGGKVSGRQAYAMVPVGSYPTPTGDRTFQQDAVDALTAFAEGKNPVLTNLSLEADDPELQAKLAKAALVQFESIDFGDNAGAIDSLLAQMAHYEAGIFEGYELSPRTGLESQNGSRADSEQHTDTAALNSEDIKDDIAEQAQPLVDAVAAINFGLPAGSCRIKPDDNTDRTIASADKILTSLANDADVAEALTEVIDLPKVFAAMDLPTLPGSDLVKALAAVKARKAAQAVAMKPGDPPENGDGKKPVNGKDVIGRNGNDQKLAIALSRAARFGALLDEEDDHE